MVLAVDEEWQIRALDRTASTLPMLLRHARAGAPGLQSNGVTRLYAALTIQAGEIIGALNRLHRAAGFVTLLKMVDRAIPGHLGVHLVIDSTSSHKTPTVRRLLAQHHR